MSDNSNVCAQINYVFSDGEGSADNNSGSDYATPISGNMSPERWVEEAPLRAVSCSAGTMHLPSSTWVTAHRLLPPAAAASAEPLRAQPLIGGAAQDPGFSSMCEEKMIMVSDSHSAHRPCAASSGEGAQGDGEEGSRGS